MAKHSTNAALYFVADVGTRALNFLAFVYLAQTLQPTLFGMNFLALSILDNALMLSDFGLRLLAQRELARPFAEREFQLGEFISARVVLALTVIGLGFVLILLLPFDPLLRSLLAAYLLSVLPNAILLEWYFQGIRDLRQILLSRGISGGAYLAAVYLLIHGPADIHLVPWIALISTLAAAIPLLFLTRREDRGRWLSVSRARLKAIYMRAFSIGIGSLFGQAILAIPPIILAYFYTDTVVGMFGPAVRIVSIALIVDRVFSTIFLSAVSSKTTSSDFVAQMTAVLKFLLVAGCGLSMLLTIFSWDILHFVFSDAYANGGYIALMILAWFILATLLNSLLAYGLIGTGNEAAFRRAGIRSALPFLVLVVGLTYVWGIIGAAISMVAGEMIMNVWLLVQFRKHFSLPLFRYAIPALLIAAVLVLVAMLLKHSPLWSAPLYLTAFLIPALFFGGIRRRELQWLTTK